MKSEKLFDCITEIKEEFIEEAGKEKFPKQKISIRKIAGMAAAFFMCSGAAFRAAAVTMRSKRPWARMSRNL